MRALALLAAAALAMSVLAQDQAPKKKRAATPVAHRKPTAEQIRKFDQLEKKHEAPQKK